MEFLRLFLVNISSIAISLQTPSGSSGGSLSERIYILGWPFKKELDIGHVLTFLTLFAGFTAWTIATIKEQRRARREEARSGALRFLLRLLRDNPRPLRLEELLGKFESPANDEKRAGYCGRNFKFKNKSEFESAIYRLDYEGKIDFLSPNEVAFRFDNRFSSFGKPAISVAPDQQKLLAIFTEALNDDRASSWDLEQLTELALRSDTDAVSAQLNQALTSENVQVRRKAAAMFTKFPAIAAARAKAAAS